MDIFSEVDQAELMSSKNELQDMLLNRVMVSIQPEAKLEEITSFHENPLLSDTMVDSVEKKGKKQIICQMYISEPNDDFKDHPYYIFPRIIDLGIKKCLQKNDKKIKYKEDGINKYLDYCDKLHVTPIKKFYKALNGDTIDFKYYGINSDHMILICLALMNNKKVKHLDFTDSWLTSEACRQLGKLIYNHQKLRTINLTGCRICPEGAEALVEGLIKNDTLTDVGFSNNNLTDEGLIILQPFLLLGTMEKLDFSDNNLGTRAGIVLSAVVLNSKKITELDLSWNALSTQGVIHLLKCLSSSETFKKLDLSWNGLYGDDLKGPLIDFIQYCRRLEYLDISHNLLRGDLLIKFVENLQPACRLKVLKIGSNSLIPKDALEILIALKKKTIHLKNLDIGDICVTLDFVKVLNEIHTTSEIQVTYGRVYHDFVIQGPNIREMLLKRADYLGKAKKKKKFFGSFVLKFKYSSSLPRTADQFMKAVEKNNMPLPPELSLAICDAFKLGDKFIAVDEMVDCVMNLWPDTTLMVVNVRGKRGKGKKGKGKKGKGKKGKGKGKSKDTKKPKAAS